MLVYSEPEKSHLEKLLTEVLKVVSEIKEVVLDLQQRQKEMDARQQVIKHEIEDAPANQPMGSFATGYQK
jgi:DNA polymerase sigma